jgi:hypothetical protein
MEISRPTEAQVALAFERAAATFGGLFPESRPIFVLGPARSGTSALGEALRLGANLPGFHEGFLFSTAYLLLTALEDRWDRIGPGVEHFRRDGADSDESRRSLVRFSFDDLRRAFLTWFHELSTADGERVWVDKTPDIYMVHALPMLIAAYPRGRVLFVRRHGVRVIDSRTRTHPEMTFEQNCRDWARVMVDWLAVRSHVGERAMEVEQADLVQQPDAVGETVAEFLALSSEQAKGIARVLKTRHPGQTVREGAPLAPGLADVDWSTEQRGVFARVCGPVMQQYGYRM